MYGGHQHKAVPTEEFLRSGHLSNSIVFLQDEVNDAPFPTAADENGTSTPRQQFMENAIRVALLLARSFVNAFGLNNNNDDEDNNSNGPQQQQQCWSSIHLADFLIDFELLPVASSNKVIVVVYGMSNFPPTDDYSPQDYLQQPDDSNGDLLEDSFGQYYGLANKNHLMAPMKVLGKLLYLVFSQGNFPAALMSFEQHDLVSCYGNSESSPACLIDDSSGRSSQRSRPTELSFFTRLLETALFPVSVCRLLSDMIDIGPAGKAEAPFASFRDVLNELEQMMSRPKLFLHDSYLHGVQVRPLFGHSFCGRSEKILPIMDISVRMEESSVAMQQQDVPAGNDNVNCNKEGGQEESNKGVEVVFVKGIAGSGKSHLVQAAGEVLMHSGWIVATAKFERGKEYASLGIVSSMFDKLLAHLVNLKQRHESPKDIAYCDRVSKSILDSIGSGALSELVGLLPSISALFPHIVGRKDRESSWHHELAYPLSKIVESFLEHSGQLVMLCCDDLQWANRNTIVLISDVLINIGRLPGISRHCLFVGMYRSNEVDDDHPLEVQKSLFHMSSGINNTTDIEVSSLSQNDIVDMLMTELKLSKRMVANLAEAVYKKTSGHAIFVVELLNSLVNESIIAYSPIKRCYTWDPDRIDFMQTGDSVAKLIASNIFFMPQKSQLILQILSCFGSQMDDSLIQVLEQFQEGIVSSVDAFVERGILVRAAGIVIWAHDLILQTAYENLVLADRQVLHFKLGQFLGDKVTWDDQSSISPILDGMDKLQLDEKLCFSGDQFTSTLASLACEQINLAGDLPIGDIKFSQWNLFVGKQMGNALNFSAALRYYEKGISFLAEDCWKRVPELSLELHRVALMVAFGLGHYKEVVRYADVMKEQLPFEDVIESESWAVSSLLFLGNIQDTIHRGIEAIQRLDIDISLPASPTEADVMNAINETYAMASQYSTGDLVNLYSKFSEAKSPHIIKLLHAAVVAFWPLDSPLFVLLACETVRYSLKHGFAPETLDAMATVGWTKLAIEGDFAAGKKMANDVRAIIASRGSLGFASIAEAMAMYTIIILIDIWFVPLRENELQMQSFNEITEKTGIGISNVPFLPFDIFSMRLHGGKDNLSILLQTALENFQMAAKTSPYYAQWAIFDHLLLAELTGGKSEDYISAFGDSYHSLDDIQSGAKGFQNIFCLWRLPVFLMLSSYWKEDFIAAEGHSQHANLEKLTMHCPLYCQLYVFFRGLVSFQRYREDGGNDRLEKGKEMLKKVWQWTQNSMAAFENKWLLLQAEHNASVGKSDLAEEMYNASIKAARDNGIIHEAALGNELLGNYYTTQGRTSDAKKCYNNAYDGYMTWGATAIADKLLQKHNLIIDVETKKRSR